MPNRPHLRPTTGWGRAAVPFVVMALGLLAVTVASLMIGAVRLAPGEVLDALLGQSGTDPAIRKIVVELRLPRALLAALIGFALGADGSAYQAMFRNPLADPFVVDETGGAAYGEDMVR